MRFDCEGSVSKEALSISLFSKLGAMPKGRRTSSSFARACWSSLYVSPHRSQVRLSESTSLCQTIGSDFVTTSQYLPRKSPPHYVTAMRKQSEFNECPQWVGSGHSRSGNPAHHRRTDRRLAEGAAVVD
jgi:hypothetical protein